VSPSRKREITCDTGHYKGKRISVISTGFGTDIIDIVFSEIDALFNIDLETGEISVYSGPSDPPIPIWSDPPVPDV